MKTRAGNRPARFLEWNRLVLFLALRASTMDVSLVGDRHEALGLAREDAVGALRVMRVQEAIRPVILILTSSGSFLDRTIGPSGITGDCQICTQLGHVDSGRRRTALRRAPEL
jgi:hypothetical protein